MRIFTKKFLFISVIFLLSVACNKAAVNSQSTAQTDVNKSAQQQLLLQQQELAQTQKQIDDLKNQLAQSSQQKSNQTKLQTSGQGNADLLAKIQALEQAQKAQQQTLANQQTQIQQNQNTPPLPAPTPPPAPTPAPQTPDLPSIISFWKPSLAIVECVWMYNDNGNIYDDRQGSGFFTKTQKLDGSFIYKLLTNRHVVAEENTNTTASYCLMVLQGDKKVVKVINDRGVNPSPISFSTTIDVGTITIDTPDDFMKNYTQAIYTRCSKGVGVDGDQIVVLGYPVNGSAIDATVTRGIISGTDGNYYITDAKIDVGDSGGVAVLTRLNCQLGIPTFVDLGVAESLPRILDIGVVGQ